MAWREDAIHRWLGTRARPKRLRGSRGHDAAILDDPKGREVCCVDLTIEGVHFELGTRAADVGFKAAGRALSDLAASGAKPRALLLAIAAPSETPERWLRSAIEAVENRARDFGADLVAGDMAATSGPCTLSVTALGVFAGTGKPPGRDRARAGDVLFCSGPVGGSRRKRHLRVEPRIELGQWLAKNGVRGLMDISDGLALDAWRIARASDVALVLEDLPVHRDAQRAAREDDRSSAWHALHDGEDHELLGTLARADWERLQRTTRGRSLHKIGRVQKGSGLFLEPGVLDVEGGVWTPGEGSYLHGS